MSPLMDAGPAAVYLGVSEDWLRRKANAGVISYRRIGARLRFTQQDLDDYIERSLQAAGDQFAQSDASKSRRRRTP